MDRGSDIRETFSGFVGPCCVHCGTPWPSDECARCERWIAVDADGSHPPGLFHVVVTRRHTKTGERVDDYEERLTATPCSHKEACTIIGKLSSYTHRENGVARWRSSFEVRPA